MSCIRSIERVTAGREGIYEVPVGDLRDRRYHYQEWSRIVAPRECKRLILKHKGIPIIGMIQSFNSAGTKSWPIGKIMKKMRGSSDSKMAT